MSPTRWGPPIDVLPLFTQEEQALGDLLVAVPAEDWRRPTACPGWSVQDVVSHILDGKLRRLARDRDAVDTLQPGPGEPLGRFVDRINEEWVQVSRRLSFEIITTMLFDFLGQTAEWWAMVDLDELGDPVSWAGPERAPAWLDAARDYTEAWVHHQQIREALGYPVLTFELGMTIADTFMRALPYTLRDVDARVGRQIVYKVTGEGGGKWTAWREPDGWTIDRGAGPSRAPVASVTTDIDTFWRLVTRNVLLADVTDKIKTTGDENVCAKMLGMVSIIVPDPKESKTRGGLRSV